MTHTHTTFRIHARRAVLALVAAFIPALASAQQDLVFIHHSVGSNWLGAGLHNALVAKSYIDKRNDITYGTVISPDTGRPASLGATPGDNTNMNHWILWFNDYLAHVKQHQSTTANRIIMFKSCYPISNIGSDGTEPGDPFSGTQSLANYRAVYRHPSGAGQTYTRSGMAYKPLEDIFAENPDTLFIPVTAPPLTWSGTDDASASRARQFNNWLKNEWLAGYNARHPGLGNVAVFDLFDVLATPATDPSHPNRLRGEYGGSSGDAHPNTAGSLAAVAAFATNPNNFVDNAWAGMGTITYNYRRYFAEGATGSFFDCVFAIANVQDSTANVRLRFLKSDGTTTSHSLVVPAMGRRTVDAKTVPALATAEFSTIVESDIPVIADRTMSWDDTGYGAHAETSLANPASLWYLAEGATHSGFQLYYVIENPNDSAVTVDISYLRPVPLPAIERSYSVLANSRYTIHVNGEGPEFSSAELSAIVRAPEATPVIVERAMYLDAGGLMYKAGHAGAGVTATATDWFFGEGSTGAYFDAFLVVANPTTSAADVEVTYLLPGGSTIVKRHDVGALSRATIWVDQEDPALADTAFGAHVTSTNGVGIVAERAMWWPGPTPATWFEAHNAAGSTATGTAWAVADGEQGGTRGTDTYLVIANTSSFAGTAQVTLMFEDGTASSVRTLSLPADSRTNVEVGTIFPEATGKRFGALIESLGTTPAAIVVERTMYWDASGRSWSAGTAAIATRLR